MQGGISQRDATISTLQGDLQQQKDLAAELRTKSKDEIVCDMQDEVIKLQEELDMARSVVGMDTEQFTLLDL